MSTTVAAPRDDAFVARLAGNVAALQAVQAIFRIGSTAAGKDDALSDVDLLAVCDRIPATHHRLRCYRCSLCDGAPLRLETLNLKSWEFGTSDSFSVAGTSVCLMYYLAPELLAKIDDICAGDGERRGFYHPTGFLNALATAQAMSTSQAEARLAEIFGKARSYPDALRRTLVHRNWYLMNYFVEKMAVGLARGDLFYSQQCVFHLREAALTLLFALAGRYRVSDKRIPDALAACRSLVPEPLWEIARELIELDTYSRQAMRDLARTLEPRIKRLEASQWRRATTF